MKYLSSVYASIVYSNPVDQLYPNMGDIYLDALNQDRGTIPHTSTLGRRGLHGQSAALACKNLGEDRNVVVLRKGVASFLRRLQR